MAQGEFTSPEQLKETGGAALWAAEPKQKDTLFSVSFCLVELTLLSSNCSGVRPAIKMVEAGGVEPPSENASSGTSPGADGHLHSLTPA